MSSRRTFVNNMDGRSYRAVNSEPNPKDFCPSCSVRLKYSARLNTFLCTQCGWSRSEKPIAFIVNGPDYNNRIKGPLRSSDSSVITADELENMKIRPLPGQAGMNRTQLSLERDRRRNLQYYDNDLRRFAEQGYNIVDVQEHVINDNSTFNSDEMRGSFSNSQSNRRMYFR